CYNFEKAANDFLLNNRKIRPIIISRNYIEKILNTKILYAVLLILTLVFLVVSFCIKNDEKIIASLKGNTRVIIGNMELKINEENFLLVKQLVNILKDSQNPMELFQKASKIRRKYNIFIEQLSWAKEIKMQTSLTKEIFNKLKSEKDIDGVVKISNDEYEELGSSEKFGAVICIK
ncbi:MAG: hypothetical protein LBF44_03795, partial [Holosporaceae bacterium]|nr:hypothetical protein [Holosporaceae bacterium]